MQALSHLETTTWNGINDTFRWTPRKRIRAPITSLPHDINLFPSIIQTTGGTLRPSFRHSAIRFCFITFRLCYWSCQVKYHEGAHHVPLFYSQQLVAIRKWLTILFAFFWAKCTAIHHNKWEQPRCIHLCIFAWPKSSGFTACMVDIQILISHVGPLCVRNMQEEISFLSPISKTVVMGIAPIAFAWNEFLHLHETPRTQCGVFINICTL